MKTKEEIVAEKHVQVLLETGVVEMVLCREIARKKAKFNLMKGPDGGYQLGLTIYPTVAISYDKSGEPYATSTTFLFS